MLNFGSNENKQACGFRYGRIVFVSGLLIGYFALIASLSGAASLLFSDRSPGEFFVFGLTVTALGAITLMFWFIRRTQIRSAAVSTLLAFVVKFGFVLMLFSAAAVKDPVILWGILSGLFVLDALPFLLLSALLFRSAGQSERPA